MASTASLVDNFNDNSFDTGLWTRTNSTQVVEYGQEVTMTSILAGNYVSIDSVNTALDLTGSYILMNIPSVGNQSLASWETYPLALLKDGSNSLTYRIIGNNVQAFKKVATVSAQVGSNLTYNPGQHRWLRMRESGGTIFWDFSADGYTWTNHTSLANPFVITALQVEISVGTFAIETSTTYMRVDSFNVPPTPKVRVGNIYPSLTVGDGMSRNEGAT